MNILNPHELVYLFFFILIGWIRFTYQSRSKGKIPALEQKSLYDIALLALDFISMVPIPLMYLFSPILNFANFKFESGLTWLGIPLMAFGIWIFWRSHADLGDSWSPNLQVWDSQTLVETGVYAHVRHPMYAAMLVTGLGQVLLLHNWIAGPSILVAGLIFVIARAPREERMLLSHYGVAYKEYMSKTGRVFPK